MSWRFVFQMVVLEGWTAVLLLVLVAVFKNPGGKA